jgi:hypothetical protein
MRCAVLSRDPVDAIYTLHDCQQARLRAAETIRGWTGAINNTENHTGHVRSSLPGANLASCVIHRSMLWILNDAMVNNPESDLWQTHWLFRTAVISTAVIAFYVQTFFCYRLWASVSFNSALNLGLLPS